MKIEDILSISVVKRMQLQIPQIFLPLIYSKTGSSAYPFFCALIIGDLLDSEINDIRS